MPRAHDLNPVIITGIAQGGQLMTTTEVDNWPADADGVQGPELMARFLAHAERFRNRITFGQINAVDLQNARLHSKAIWASTLAMP